MGLRVPSRESREADIQKGVGDAVKISLLRYWRMLGTSLSEEFYLMHAEFAWSG